MLLQCTFFALVALIAAVANEEALDNLTFFLQNIRTLWVVAASTREGMPNFVQQVLSVLNFLAGDLSFTHPDCLGVQSFAGVYGLNIAGMCSFITHTYCVAFAACILFFVAIVHIRFSIKTWRSTRAVVAKYAKDFRELHHQWRKRQFACGVIALFVFAFELFEVHAWGTLYCRWVGGQLLLVEDPHQV